jgi:hypothetical protein
MHPESVSSSAEGESLADKTVVAAHLGIRVTELDGNVSLELVLEPDRVNSRDGLDRLRLCVSGFPGGKEISLVVGTRPPRRHARHPREETASGNCSAPFRERRDRWYLFGRRRSVREKNGQPGVLLSASLC